MSNYQKYLKAGAHVRLSGDSKDMWIKDYNVRVCSHATVLATPKPHDKKVLVNIDYIDGDTNVTTYIRKTACKNIILF